MDLSRLLDEAAIDRELVARGGLPEFVKLAWHVLEPMEVLKWGWATDAICEHLTAVSNGEITRLLINVPPGMMKSLLTCVFWTAWEWGPRAQPGLRVIGTSHSADFSTRDCRKTRDLVLSPWYQLRWGALAQEEDKRLVSLVLKGDTNFSNSATGWRRSMAFASLTGDRGNRLLIDDPHSVETAESDLDRARTVRIFKEGATSRLIDPILSAIVIIMQRLNMGDVSAAALASGSDYTHLMLPMEFEPERRCTTSIGFRDPRTVEDELLFPERFPRGVVDRDKRVMGSFAVAGQYQQRPAPRGGGIVKEAWLAHRFRERGTKPLRVVQSLDCASKPDQRNDPTVNGTFAVFPDHVELWEVLVKRQEFPALLRTTKDQAAAYKPNVVLIEDKDAGQQLGQTLKDSTTLPVKMINPGSLDKVTRMDTETPFLEAGNLWLPEEAPWVAAYVEELTTFPAAAHDDQVDMTSQFLKWHREHGVRGKLPPGGPGSLERSSPNKP